MAPVFCFDVFSSREPISSSLENAAAREIEKAVFREATQSGSHSYRLPRPDGAAVRQVEHCAKIAMSALFKASSVKRLLPDQD